MKGLYYSTVCTSKNWKHGEGNCKSEEDLSVSYSLFLTCVNACIEVLARGQIC